MASKARVQKRLYYWETEFPALTPSKSRSGQRVYSEKELEIIRRIKELLYEEGYTIAGAKKKLEGELASGALAEPEGEGAEGAPESPEGEDEAAGEPPAQGVLPALAAAEPEPPLRAAVKDAPPPAALDRGEPERVQRLLSGIEEALQEARELLTLLGPKSP